MKTEIKNTIFGIWASHWWLDIKIIGWRFFMYQQVQKKDAAVKPEAIKTAKFAICLLWLIPEKRDSRVCNYCADTSNLLITAYLCQTKSAVPFQLFTVVWYGYLNVLVYWLFKVFVPRYREQTALRACNNFHASITEFPLE